MMESNSMTHDDLRPRKCRECDWGLSGEAERQTLVTITCNCTDERCNLKEVTFCPMHAQIATAKRTVVQLHMQTVRESEGEGAYQDWLDEYDRWVEQGRPPLPDEEDFDSDSGFMMPGITL